MNVQKSKVPESTSPKARDEKINKSKSPEKELDRPVLNKIEVAKV